MLFQQGDLLLKQVRAPKGLKKAKRVERENGRFILARGEVTGHAHVVENDVELFEVDGTLYCRAKEAFEVKHEEHKTVKVPPGTFEVQRVKEYDHFAEEARQVRD
jgi:hypothetical protein